MLWVAATRAAAQMLWVAATRAAAQMDHQDKEVKRMESHVHSVVRSSPSRRWFLLTLSVLVSFVLLLVILLSFSTVEAEPLAPAANISGTVVQPGGSPITQATWVCLKYLHPEGWPDDVEFVGLSRVEFRSA